MTPEQVEAVEVAHAAAFDVETRLLVASSSVGDVCVPPEEMAAILGRLAVVLDVLEDLRA